MYEKSLTKGMSRNTSIDAEKEQTAIKVDEIRGVVLDKVKVGDHFSLVIDLRSSGISTNGLRARLKPGDYTVIAFYPNYILTERIDRVAKENFEKMFEDGELPTIDWHTGSLKFNPPKYVSKESFTYMEMYQIINKVYYALEKEEKEE